MRPCRWSLKRIGSASLVVGSIRKNANYHRPPDIGTQAGRTPSALASAILSRTRV